MSFDLYDFTESMKVAGVPENRAEHCSLAFGHSPEDYSSWEGGFVCHTRSGKPWIFVFGWCDTTGWGCQDGAYVREYDAEPTLEQLAEAWSGEFPYHDGFADFDVEDFDKDPADVNRYLVGELDRWGDPVSPAIRQNEET